MLKHTRLFFDFWSIPLEATVHVTTSPGLFIAIFGKIHRSLEMWILFEEQQQMNLKMCVLRCFSLYYTHGHIACPRNVQQISAELENSAFINVYTSTSSYVLIKYYINLKREYKLCVYMWFL